MKSIIRDNKKYLVKIPAPVKPLLKRIGILTMGLGMPAYAVGGCVRDWYLGIHRPPDLDITVEGDGMAAAKVCAKVLGRRVRVHAQFKTATLLPVGKGSRVDFATCRKESYSKPAAYPRVSTGTLEEDLFRRDFTINAMALALDPGRFARLADPFGGRRDLAAGKLRVLHPQSFLDDPSRILRGLRFAVRFKFQFEEQTARQLKKAVASGALGWLNAGRLERELMRMLEEADAAACIRLLEKTLR